MIIILKDADFSANNLGKVTVNKELNDFTKAAIAASGNTAMTEYQQWALEDFFEKIGATTNSGVFSKLQFLCIPYIAGGLEQSLVDYKDNSVIAVPDSSSYAMVDKGIKAITSSNTSPIILDGKYNFKHNSRSVLVTVTSANGYNSDSPATCATKLLTIGTATDERYDVKIQGRSKGGLNFSCAEGSKAVAGNFCSSDFMQISNTGAFVVKDDSAWMYAANNDSSKLLVLESSVSVNESDKVALFSAIGRIGNNINSLPIGLLAAGEYLTEEEVKVFRTAANELKDFFI